MRIGMEPMGGTAKMNVDGNAVSWSAGDMVHINNHSYSIHLNGSEAYISEFQESGDYYGIFPASLLPENTQLNGSETTVTIPSSCKYSEAGGIQRIDMPMAAYAPSGSNIIQFKHIGGAIAVEVKTALFSECAHFSSTSDGTLYLDNIVVTSDRYQLSGQKTITLNTQDIAGAATTSDVEDDRKVTIFFAQDSYELTDASKYIIIPVLPVGSDNHFTITVTAHRKGDCYVVGRTQNTGGVLDRSELGYVPATVPQGATKETKPILPYRVGADGKYKFYIYNDSTYRLFVKIVNSQPEWVYFRPGVNTDAPYWASDYEVIKDFRMEDTPVDMIEGYGGNGQNAMITGTNVHEPTEIPTTVTYEKRTISNLHINCGEDGPAFGGMFQSLNRANTTIQYIKLKDARFNINALWYDRGNNDKHNNQYIGGIVGQVSKTTGSGNPTNINNCEVDGLKALNINARYETSGSISLYTSIVIGGIVGSYNIPNGSISNCTVKNIEITTNIRATDNATRVSTGYSTKRFVFGGIVGFFKIGSGNSFTFDNCTYEQVTSPLNLNQQMNDNVMYYGGLIGQIGSTVQTEETYNITLNNCTLNHRANLRSNWSLYAGGFFGMVCQNANVTFNGTNTLEGSMAYYQRTGSGLVIAVYECYGAVYDYVNLTTYRNVNPVVTQTNNYTTNNFSITISNP